MTTLEALDQLENAGFNRTQARAIVAAFEQGDARRVTKGELDAALAQLKADLYRALWAQGGALAALILAAKLL